MIPTGTTVYVVVVYEEQGWWMAYVPALDVLTQARVKYDVPNQARDLIATVLDCEPAEVSVALTAPHQMPSTYTIRQEADE